MSRTPDDDRALTRGELRLIVQTLASLLGATAEGYSSRRGHGPPGYEHRRWQALAREIGTKRGRWWHVSREALTAYEATRQEPSRRAPVETTTSSEAIARKLGLRLVGGAR